MGSKSSTLSSRQDLTRVEEPPSYWQDDELEDAAVAAIMDETDYYRLLGVRRNASSNSIRRAYHQLMRRHHPDKGGNSQVAAKLAEAYAVLSDSGTKAKYDADRAGFLHRKIYYAKNVVANTYESVSSCTFSHYVDPQELNLGDHVYYYMDWSCGAQHHGIVSSIDGGSGNTCIIDFGVGNSTGDGFKPVHEVPLSVFLPKHRHLRRAQYRDRRSSLKLVASYHEASDVPEIVVRRARRLLMLKEMEYSLLVQSCETVAFWCKTGKRFSGQAAKAQRVLVAGALSLATAGGAVAVVGAATTGLVVVEEVVRDGVVVATIATGLTGAGIAAVTVGSAAAAVSCVYGGFIAWRAYSRKVLARAQPLEVINLITKLETRDRRTIAQDKTYELGARGGVVPGLAERFDKLADPLSSQLSGEPDAPDKLRDDVCAHLEAAANQFFEGDFMSADDLLPFVVQVLARCETFNAVLDLPPPEGQDQRAFYLTVLKTAEMHLIEIRRVAFERIETSITTIAASEPDESQQEQPAPYPEAKVRWRFWKPARKIRVEAAVQIAVGERTLEVSAEKSEAEFADFHRSLLDLHPRVQKIQTPKQRMRDSTPVTDAYAAYIIDISDLTKEPDDPIRVAPEPARDRNDFYITEYLTLLQRIEIGEQLLLFLSPGSLAAVTP